MRYVLGFLGAVALIVLVFILVLRGFGGGRHSNVQSELTDYAPTETVMRLSIDGPVDAEQTHRRVRITVGRSDSTVELLQGYQENVIATQSYTSNETAYRTFLRALQLQGYTKGNTDPKKADDTGVCPTGKRYAFEVITGSATVQRFWTTSCGGGTFRGNAAVIRVLFRAQIPDYAKVTRSTGLN